MCCIQPPILLYLVETEHTGVLLYSSVCGRFLSICILHWASGVKKCSRWSLWANRYVFSFEADDALRNVKYFSLKSGKLVVSLMPLVTFSGIPDYICIPEFQISIFHTKTHSSLRDCTGSVLSSPDECGAPDLSFLGFGHGGFLFISFCFSWWCWEHAAFEDAFAVKPLISYLF